MKRVILAVAMVIGVAQGVDTEDKKTLLVGVRPHEFAKRDYYRKLAPNTGLWALTDTLQSGNDGSGESKDTHQMAIINFYGKKVGFNGAKDNELDYDFDTLYGEPSSKQIVDLFLDFDRKPPVHHLVQTIKERIKSGEIKRSGIIGWSKELQSHIASIGRPMIMYGMPFVSDGALTPEGKKHTDTFDTVIVDHNVMKFLVGIVNTTDKNVFRTIWALNALLKVGGDLIVLNPGFTLNSSVKEIVSGLKGRLFDDVRIGNDTFSGYGGPMIHFHNKRKDIFGGQHDGAGDVPVWNRSAGLIQRVSNDIEEYEKSKEPLTGAKIGRIRNLKKGILEAQKYIEHCQKLESGKNSSQCAEAQQYMEDAFAVLNQARQIPSLAHHVDQQ